MFYKVNNLIFDCEYTRSRTGFNHVVKIRNKRGVILIEVKTHYQNRTWESYDFQTAMMRAQDKLKKAIKHGDLCYCKDVDDWSDFDFSNQPSTACFE